MTYGVRMHYRMSDTIKGARANDPVRSRFVSEHDKIFEFSEQRDAIKVQAWVRQSWDGVGRSPTLTYVDSRPWTFRPAISPPSSRPSS